MCKEYLFLCRFKANNFLWQFVNLFIAIMKNINLLTKPAIRKKSFFFWVFILYAITISFEGYSENSNHRISSYVKGLSNSSITCIFQDSDQLMWFGTWDGLNLYNGRYVKSFFPEAGNAHSISHNIIRAIDEQYKHILWVTTDHGVNRLDTRTMEFTPFWLGYEALQPGRENSFSLSINSQGTVIASSLLWGLAYYCESTNSFEPIISPLIKTQNIQKIAFDNQDNLWILHTDGNITVLKIAEENMSVEIKSAKDVLIGSGVRDLYALPNYMALLNTSNQLQLYNISNENIRSILERPIQLQGKLTSASYYDNILYLSLGTSGGECYRINGAKAVKDYNFPELSNNSILCTYQSSQHILWLGTDGNGVINYRHKNQLFRQSIEYNPRRPIRAFIEDNNGNLFIATKGSGLYKRSLNGSLKKYTLYNTKNGLLHNNILALAKNKKGDIFIGGDGKGINIITSKGLFTLQADPNVKIAFNELSAVYSLVFQNQDNTLWVGTNGNGLFKLNLKENGNGQYIITGAQQYVSRLSKTYPMNRIFKILPSDDKKLWLATRGSGVVLFNPANESFEIFQHQNEGNDLLCSNDVLSLYIDEQKQLWVGTSAGLSILKKSKEDE